MIRARQVVAVMNLFLRRALLHPHTLASTFLTPIIIALIFGTADARAVSQISIGVVQAPTPAATKFVETLEHEPGVNVRRFSTRVGLIQAVRRADVAAGLVVPTEGDPEVVGDETDPVFTAARAQVLSVAARLGVTAPARDARDAPVEISKLPTTKRSHQTGIPRAAGGMLVYFVFANATFTALFLLDDRARGVFVRAAGSPVPSSAIATGEVLGRFVIALVQAVLIAVIATVFFNTEWGALLPFFIVLIMLSAIAAAMSVLIGVALPRPGPQQTAAATAIVAVTALLGGCFWSLAIVPAAMRTIGYATPEAWVLRAIESLAARGAGIVDILPELLVMLAFAVALLALAAVALGRAAIVPRGAA